MRSRRGLVTLPVCALMLAMMAISASGAQAGMWMVNKATVGSGELKVEASIEVEPLGEAKEKHVVILTTSGANKIDILCGELTAVKGAINLEEIVGTLNFKTCTTKINGKAEPGCTPLSQPIPAGGKVFAVLHGSKPYAKAEGTSGVFLTMKFNEETCVALTPSNKISGVLWIEDCNGEFEVEKVTHLIQEAKVPAEKLGGIFFGANKASIDGSVNIKFADAEHVGQTFSLLAE